MTNTISGNRFAGAAALIAGAVWVYFTGDDLYATLTAGRLFPDFILMMFLALPGFFILLYGISQYIYFEKTTIYRDSVSWERQGLSGHRRWREPLSGYRGVLKTHRYLHSNKVRNNSRMKYEVRLVHPDSQKDIVLYRAECDIPSPPADWLESWKRFARLLELPAMEKNDDGISSCDAGYIDQPLIRKIRDGKIHVERIDPLNTRLGWMAGIERDGDIWIITCYPVWTMWKSIAGVIVMAAALLGAYGYGVISPQMMKWFLMLILVCVAAIGLSIRKHLTHREQVAVDENNIYYRYRNKNKWVTENMPLKSIYGTTLKSDPGHFRTAGDICIEGKNRNIRFGWWLPLKTKRRIKTCLPSLIAHDLKDI